MVFRTRSSAEHFRRPRAFDSVPARVIRLAAGVRLVKADRHRLARFTRAPSCLRDIPRPTEDEAVSSVGGIGDVSGGIDVPIVAADRAQHGCNPDSPCSALRAVSWRCRIREIAHHIAQRIEPGRERTGLRRINLGRLPGAIKSAPRSASRSALSNAPLHREYIHCRPRAFHRCGDMRRAFRQT